MPCNIILIPARSGSERVKGKNLRLLGGKPLMGHMIECAIKSNVGEVYVSTDNSEYKTIAKSFGAKAPFKTKISFNIKSKIILGNYSFLKMV